MAKRKRKNLPSKRQLPSSLVDIVIPVYNRFDLLERCLRAIPEAADGILHHVILVDNASTEAGDFYSQYPQHTVIRNKENVGFPLACNYGAKQGKAPLIFFLNSDVILHPLAIRELVYEMDNPEIGVAGSKLFFPSADEHLHDARNAGKIQHIGLASNIKGDIFHQFIGWEENEKTVKVHDVLAVTGAALMTRRNLWNKIGGFDLMYSPGTYEDVDYCLNVQAMGSRVVICQGSSGIHFANATGQKYNIAFPLNRNQLLFKAKWQGRYPWTAWQYA